MANKKKEEPQNFTGLPGGCSLGNVSFSKLHWLQLVQVCNLRYDIYSLVELKQLNSKSKKLLKV